MYLGVSYTAKGGPLMTDYEKEYTAPFEGTYSEEEVVLNRQLYEECVKEHPDWNIAELLLQQGADPLGATAVSGWGLLEHVYNELAFESQFSKSVNLPRITELFLKYKMDVENPKVPYDDENSLHPLWTFAFLMNENAIIALKMLLDYNLSNDGIAEMWDHILKSLYHLESGDPNEDEWNYEYTWMMKVLMLCISYDHILKADTQYYEEWLGCDYNAPYDLHKFRNWNDFDYVFDTSYGRGSPDMCQTIVRIYEKESQKEIWRIAFWPDGEKILRQQFQEQKSNR